MATKKNIFSLVLLLFILLPLLVFNGWCGWQIHLLANQRAQIKKDYSAVNSIRYGLLSIQVWKHQLQDIVCEQIENFDFTKDQEKVLREQISKILHALITQADSMLQSDRKTLGGKIRKMAVNTFVNKEEIRKKVPHFTEIIVKEITKPQSKAKLKELVQQKISEYGALTYDTATDLSHINNSIDHLPVLNAIKFTSLFLLILSLPER